MEKLLGIDILVLVIYSAGMLGILSHKRGNAAGLIGTFSGLFVIV